MKDKVVFFGASTFGLKCLKVLSDMDDITINGVVSAPEKFSISYNPEGVKNILHTDFSSFCSNASIPFYEIKSMKGSMSDPDLLFNLNKWKPDYFIVIGWYHMVTKKIRDIAPAFGMHASLLPNYSGGAPLVWSLINDEKKTGISFFKLMDGVDDGPIVDQKSTQILESDNIATLYQRIEDLGMSMLTENLPGILNRSNKFKVQDEKKRVVYPQRSPEDGLINWNWDSRQVWNFVRAQTNPYPGAFFYFGKKKISIIAGRYHQDFSNKGLVVGEIVSINSESVKIKCGKGAFEIQEYRINGIKENNFRKDFSIDSSQL